MMDKMTEPEAMAERQQQFARRMRAQPTEAERVAWRRLQRARDSLRRHRNENN